MTREAVEGTSLEAEAVTTPEGAGVAMTPDPVGDLTTRDRLTDMSLVTATVAAAAAVVEVGRLTSLEDLIAVEGEEIDLTTATESLIPAAAATVMTAVEVEIAATTEAALIPTTAVGLRTTLPLLTTTVGVHPLLTIGTGAVTGAGRP